MATRVCLKNRIGIKLNSEWSKGYSETSKYWKMYLNSLGG